MSDNVVSLTGAIVSETTGHNLWEAAIVKALAENAIYGVLVYVNADGESCCISIGCDRVSFRGLIEETRDDLRSA